MINKYWFNIVCLISVTLFYAFVPYSKSISIRYDINKSDMYMKVNEKKNKLRQNTKELFECTNGTNIYTYFRYLKGEKEIIWYRVNS